MTVIFTKDGKVDHIVSTGDVVITQPGRITHSGQCEYFREDDKFVLTDQPVIVDHGNQLSAPKITIYRTNQTLMTEGKAPRRSCEWRPRAPAKQPLPAPPIINEA